MSLSKQKLIINKQSNYFITDCKIQDTVFWYTLKLKECKTQIFENTSTTIDVQYQY